MSSDNESIKASQTNNGDEVRGDKVMGDKTTVGNIDNSTAVAIGTGATATVTITEEAAYTVHGLTNPYLGLRAFEYKDSAIYAGREQLAQETIQRLTAPGAQQTILFITGASGSGKSSFAQAALILLLEKHYKPYQKEVKPAIFRPSIQPMVMLADALQKLHPDLTPETLATNTPKEQINLLLIDQFEELFIQSDASQRAPFCDFLTNLPSFERCRTHILITLRVDYLDELFAIQPLWAIAKEGVELRTMSADDLRNAIQKPLQVHYPQKSFAPELLDRLVQDAGEDAALLPLLQVTLAELWKTGKLVLSNYHSLTNAIRQRAETVYAFSDHANADPKTPRPDHDQQGLMSILLDLINVSVDGTDHRDARQRRTRQELEQGSAQRPRLIEELVNARLLAAASETRNGRDVEVIDIIHESLIDNWDRLRNAIEEQRQQLQRRARFKLWLGEWLRNERQNGYLLLTDMQLAEVRTLVEGRDIEVQGAEAREFCQRSADHQEVARLHRLEQSEARARAEARAEAEIQTAKKLRIRAIYLSITALIAVITAAAAGILFDAARKSQRQAEIAVTAESKARNSAEIAATGEAQARASVVAAKRLVEADLWQKEAKLIKNDKPQLALLLALEAWPIQQSRGDPHASDATRNMVELLTDIRGIPLVGHNASVNDLTFSPDGHWLVSTSDDATVRLWDMDNLNAQPMILQGRTAAMSSATISLDSHWLAAASDDGAIWLWILDKPAQSPRVLHGHTAAVTNVTFAQQGQLISISDDQTMRLWDIRELKNNSVVLSNYEDVCRIVTFSSASDWFRTLCELAKLREMRPRKEGILPLDYMGHIAFSANDQWIAGVTDPNGKIMLWQRAALQNEPYTVEEIKDIVKEIAFNRASNHLAAGSDQGIIYMWDIESSNLRSTFHSHEAEITAVAFSPYDKWFASASADGVIRLWGGKDYAEDTWQQDYFPELTWTNMWLPSGCDLSCNPGDPSCLECRETEAIWETVEKINLDNLIELACRRVGRSLTSQEWQQYFGGMSNYRPTCSQWPIHSSVQETSTTSTPASMPPR